MSYIRYALIDLTVTLISMLCMGIIVIEALVETKWQDRGILFSDSLFSQMVERPEHHCPCLSTIDVLTLHA